MKHRPTLSLLLIVVNALFLCAAALAQDAGSGKPPPDPWPRVVDLANGQVLAYQPQVITWADNRLEFRAALAIKPQGAKEESFGTIVASARTQVDKLLRTVTFENLRILKIDFPTLPENGAAYAGQLKTQFAKQVRTIALDRLEASLALAGIKPPTVAVQNDPPQVIVSYSPAILVPIDGAPVLKTVPDDSRFQRVINTRALILQGGFEQNFYLHVYDGWLEASAIGGPWTLSQVQPIGMDRVAASIAKSGTVDMLDGGSSAQPKPSLANGVPAIYTSQVPAELIVFNGQPNFVPITGTQLLWAANTTSDTLIDTANSNYYVLMSGRWFRAAALTGPWTFVPNDALPADFARIPPQAPAGAVLPTVAGTSQAQEAVISNSIPQTATVPLKNGPTFTPNFDGPPQYSPIAGTSLSYVVNSSEPVIQVAPNAYYAVVAGVWFTAPGITGPWTIATSVPPVIYTIPPSSPLFYVTYVKIYEATPQYVYTGYTPGYLGTVVSPYGTVVYGTGYAYAP
ncbi:MAG TPA: carbohydrate-binding family V/XII, partial [Rubrivivax sp.]|nr:carbohydrate-binding family V/XII [Rubrivivax sp.]